MMEIRETEASTLTLGFVGVGWIGKNRMEAILKTGLAEAARICEPSGDNAKMALISAPGATVVECLSDICAGPDLDGVVIATPSALHASQCIEALNAGKAVFCQKPLGRTAAEVKEVVEAARKNDKALAVDLSYRYTKAFQAVHKLIRQGELGEIYAVDLVFHNAYGPDKDWFYNKKQSGGGCVMDLGIHLIDMALWSLDFPEIKTVESQLFYKGRRLKDVEAHTEDFARVSLQSEDTAIGLQCSWNLPAGSDAVIEARFYGTKGGAAFRNTGGSFYDFIAERYNGTKTEVLVGPPDDWGGRAGVEWIRKLSENKGFEENVAREFVEVANVIDRIYGSL